MTGTEIQEQELKDIIAQSIDESVDKALQKYGKQPRIRRRFFIKNWISLLIAIVLVAAIVAAGVYLANRSDANKAVAPVEDHDLTLENNGIFGFTVADFEEPILGKAMRQRLLIVEEQEVYVNTTITEAGMFNWGVFNKQQAIVIHGTGQYTIDLTQITADDISLNEDTYELTIRIPHAVLHGTIFDPAKTEIGDPQNGWLAFGSIKMDMKQNQEFEVTAKGQLTDKLSEAERFEEADRFAKLSAYETFQPIVKTVSPAYKVIIEFQEGQ